MMCEFCAIVVDEVAHHVVISEKSTYKVSFTLLISYLLNIGFISGIYTAFHAAGLLPLILLLFEPVYMLLEMTHFAIKFTLSYQRIMKEKFVDEQSYYVDTICDIVKLSLTLVNGIHILGHAYSVSYAHCFLLFYIKNVLQNLLTRIRVFTNYMKVIRLIHQTFDTATCEQLQRYGDPCAICYEMMRVVPSTEQEQHDEHNVGNNTTTKTTTPLVEDSRVDHSVAKVLSCGHVFHLRCIRQWMEHQNTCPICKRQLLSPLHETTPATTTTTTTNNNNNEQHEQQNNEHRAGGVHHIVHRAWNFGFGSWFPHVTFEVNSEVFTNQRFPYVQHNAVGSSNAAAHIDPIHFEELSPSPPRFSSNGIGAASANPLGTSAAHPSYFTDSRSAGRSCQIQRRHIDSSMTSSSSSSSSLSSSLSSHHWKMRHTLNGKLYTSRRARSLFHLLRNNSTYLSALEYPRNHNSYYCRSSVGCERKRRRVHSADAPNATSASVDAAEVTNEQQQHLTTHS
jgi:hypothetical protein